MNQVTTEQRADIAAALRSYANGIEAGREPIPAMRHDEADGCRMRIVPRVVHNLLCAWRVATPQETDPVVLACAGCGLCYPQATQMGDRPAAGDDRRQTCDQCGVTAPLAELDLFWGAGVEIECRDTAACKARLAEIPDILDQARAHLVQCGPCDYGLVNMGCNCPEGDPRVVIADLVTEVERLRVETDA